MTRAGKNLLWGVLGIVLATAATLLATDPGQYPAWAYHYFGGDYTKTGEVYELTIARPYKVENMFMGSSHTYNGIDDGQINRTLGDSNSYNAAIPTSGRDFEYAVLERVFAQSAPKRLFIEVRETEERVSHFGFPIVAPLSDVMTAPPNPWWLKNAFMAVQYRFERLTWLVPALRRDNLAPVTPSRTGYRPNPLQMDQAKLRADAASVLASKRWHLLPAAFGDLEYGANESYVRAIARLCKAHGTELHFLYLPFMGAPAEPLQAGFYRGLGTLHTMPDAIRNNARFFADPTHFNPEGAKIYTGWLISDVLRRQPGKAM